MTTYTEAEQARFIVLREIGFVNADAHRYIAYEKLWRAINDAQFTEVAPSAVDILPLILEVLEFCNPMMLQLEESINNYRDWRAEQNRLAKESFDDLT